ncbi:hypothetical protein PZ897_15840 [Hoeflea sp. YIM 152468]|uniref:hypothetical protein n=1 Tax=Hoeflea sp. YIM 152468 TaxID=3031759 RepID=UPI0023D9ED8B|nr:hypothetical protein [Hoeflea sp. YIM 152468]MDF1609658.1 hypothetical protein [Hoeflea sp. YIM 152468]
MFQDDDFFPAKPARRENAAIVRIALMALMGCLILISVLVIQSRAEPGVMAQRPMAPVHGVQDSHPASKPSGTIKLGPQQPSR